MPPPPDSTGGVIAIAARTIGMAMATVPARKTGETNEESWMRFSPASTRKSTAAKVAG